MKPILKSEILDAIAHTNSNSAAARYLGANYARYRRFAMAYDLWFCHLNEKGVGTPKGFANLPTTVKLKDIFANKHPNYSLNRLKWRMITKGLLIEKCANCGFDEQRLTDGKRPLILTFKDGVRTNMAKENIYLLCWNCCFLITGTPQLAHRRQLQTAMKHPHVRPYPQTWIDENNKDVIIRPVPEEDYDELAAGTLDTDTITKIQKEIQEELNNNEE
jgi:hypothetical protein